MFSSAIIRKCTVQVAKSPSPRQGRRGARTSRFDCQAGQVSLKPWALLRSGGRAAQYQLFKLCLQGHAIEQLASLQYKKIYIYTHTYKHICMYTCVYTVCIRANILQIRIFTKGATLRDSVSQLVTGFKSQRDETMTPWCWTQQIQLRGWAKMSLKLGGCYSLEDVRLARQPKIGC